MQQLTASMTAHEFGLHYDLERVEPLETGARGAAAMVIAALANGPLKPRSDGRIWVASDFSPDLWESLIGEAAPNQPEPTAMTVDQIMARARLAGMVQ